MSTPTKTESKSADSETTSEDTSREIKKNFRERIYLPLAIPLVVSAIVALMGISFSKVFLAGAGGHSESGAVEVAGEAAKSSAPVMWASIITLVVLFGAAGISAMKSMRGTSFTLLIAGGIVAVIVAGSVLAGASDVTESAVEFGRPTEAEITEADPTNVLAVDALGSNQFQSKKFEAKAGVLKIDYIGKGGSHRLKFKDARFNWFDLVVASAGAVDSGEVKLEPGSYYIFCPIPGHEAAGMYADLEVK